VALHEDLQPVRTIAEKLHVSKTIVCHWIEVYERTGDVCDAPRSGRPRCTDEATDVNIAVDAIVQPFI